MESQAGSEGVAGSRLLGWMGRAAVLGLLVGLAAGIFWLTGG